MEGRSRHCPHLGLKHTRSIRFSSPTPEHRCYIFGEPLEIQVDQRTYCLGDRYPECPRFAGQEAPPAPAAARPARAARAGGKGGGLVGFWHGLGKRDRILYLSLIGLLVAILATYGVLVGIILPGTARLTPTAVPSTQAVPPTTVVVVVPTVEPTTAPTAAPTTVPTVAPTVRPTSVPTTVRTTSAPTTVAVTEKPPTTNTPFPPTATPEPTSVPPTAAPTAIPTQPPPPPESVWSLLYFLGPNKAYYVPVERESEPYTEGVARRALEQMILGPRGSLLRSMPAGMGLNDVYRLGATLYVDLDHTFESLGAGQKEALAVVLAMTAFDGVERVQFLVNGAAYGLPGSGNTNPVERPAYVNFEDPYAVDPGNATDLVLYFATPDGAFLFPMVRRVEFTEGVARKAIEEMILGPSGGYAALRLIPADTEIQYIDREINTIVVDFNSAFLNASDVNLAIQAVTLAMCDLRADMNLGVTAVRISVDGVVLGTFGRPRVNPE